MAFRLFTSFCLLAPLTLQLACSACGGSAPSAGESAAQHETAYGAVQRAAQKAAQHNAPPGVPPAATVCHDCAAGTFCNSNGVCTPETWDCGPMYYGGGASDGCDCDCGTPDPDCDLPGVQRWCYGAGSPVKVADCAACSAPAPEAPE